MAPLTNVDGVGPILARLLARLGITTISDLSDARAESLLVIPGVGMRRAEGLIAAARKTAPVPSAAPSRQARPRKGSKPPRATRPVMATGPAEPVNPAKITSKVTGQDSMKKKKKAGKKDTTLPAAETASARKADAKIPDVKKSNKNGKKRKKTSKKKSGKSAKT